MALRLGHSATQKHAPWRVFRSFLSSKPLLGPLLARDTSGPAFGAPDDPETRALARVLWLSLEQAPVGAPAR